ncbi:D-glycero-beta-D-manno-heptose-7-phosphate kinase [Methyloversatilis sp. XJ19-13]|uniref:D-glycero-beta-D-manno-heptose-7-phosphate kinase n=1 Tax=Methyloversatilis sp. XJ19-13 TaxID=2963430 RepID=UPI00211C996F|nr:D-glycero-beta-D-manno-heptose-7-phosphate kinase [Methyloversatilis sp. XJ19-13]MCQ9373927.1 D-glycero-beta-D-manno-heptose-7-phosphate kinase [Methyloversatilis sp. XJ19-13]
MRLSPSSLSLPDTSRARILVAGDVMLDRYWFGDVQRISPEAPVPVVKIDRVEERPGGAANVARNCAALGAHVSLLSVVGADEAACTLREQMKSADIDASLHEDTALSTTIKLRVIGRQQQLLRIDFENMPTHEVLRAKLDEFARRVNDADLVILSDYGKGALSNIRDMMEIARTVGKPVLVDPKGDDYSRYAGATLLKPNRNELREVVGRWLDDDDLARRAHTLRDELNLGALLLTRSDAGMSLYDGSGVIHEPALAREVYDVSGAGDTVIATMAVMLAAGSSMPDAMRLANRAAGIVVAKLGTAVCSLDELAADLRHT